MAPDRHRAAAPINTDSTADGSVLLTVTKTRTVLWSVSKGRAVTLSHLVSGVQGRRGGVAGWSQGQGWRGLQVEGRGQAWSYPKR